MTISSEDRSTAPFTGNGVATSFPFTFKVFTASDLVVVLTDADGVDNVLVLDSDYSVTLNPDQDNNPGGTITYPIIGSPLAVGESLIAYGDITYLQPADIVNQSGFYPRVVENALDRVTMLIQQVLGLARRAIRVPVSAANVNTELPDIAQRAGRIVAFDDEGNVIVSNKTLLEVEGNADIREGSRTTQQYVATAGQTSVDTIYEFAPGTDQVAVNVNGSRLVPGVDYTETDPNTITFAQPLQEGDAVLVELFGRTTNFVDEVNVGFAGGTLHDLRDSTSPSKGAALVGYSQGLNYASGAGLALNQLFTKSARLLFSDDYGADATGVTSASAAINALFTAAKASGKIAIIRPGTYRITSQCDYSGLTVFAHGASFNIDHSAANATQDVTGFRAIASDSHWDGGSFDIVGTSFNQANAANINGTRQGGFWIGEYLKSGALSRIERVSLRNMRWRCTGGFHGCNQIQLTGNLSGVTLDEIHGLADSRAGRLIAFEWGRDTVANKTYHPENIQLGTITGGGYRQKFSGAVVFLSGVCDVACSVIRADDSAQPVRIVAGDNGETLSMPQYVGRVLKGLHFDVISGTAMQWRGFHLSGRGDAGNVSPCVTVGNMLVSGNGNSVPGGYFEGVSGSFAGGETGSYSGTGMKAVYRAFGNLTIDSLRIQDFAGYGYYQGNSADADCSANSSGACVLGLLDAYNIGGPAFYVSAPTAAFEVLRINEINAQICAAYTSQFTSNLSAFGGYGVSDGDLTRIVEVSIGSGRIGATGPGASFGIRSPGGNVRANYQGLKVGNATVFSTAVSHGSGASNDRVTHVGCDFVGTTAYGGKAAVGVLA